MPYYKGKHMSSMEYDSLYHAGLIEGTPPAKARGKIIHPQSPSRTRGTAIVLRDNKVLLVRDKGKNKYSLPGGGTNKDEPSMASAIRELYEELGMSAKKAERIFRCDFKGSLNKHKVVLVETDDEPRLRGKELDEFIWWDMETEIFLYDHVKAILGKLGENV